MTDWSASTFSVTSVDRAVNAKAERTSFLSEADKMTYDNCAPDRLTNRDHTRAELWLTVVDDPAYQVGAPLSLQLIGRKYEEEAIVRSVPQRLLSHSIQSHGDGPRMQDDGDRGASLDSGSTASIVAAATRHVRHWALPRAHAHLPLRESHSYRLKCDLLFLTSSSISRSTSLQYVVHHHLTADTE